MQLKVASYNIRKAVGLDWRRRPQRVLQVLVETGVLGAIPFLAACVAVGAGLLRRPRDLRYLGPVAGIVITENLTSTALGWGGPVALITWLTLAAVFVWRAPPDNDPPAR
jgi:O-antigen ligase